jgi:hypothetical protein
MLVEERLYLLRWKEAAQYVVMEIGNLKRYVYLQRRNRVGYVR